MIYEGLLLFGVIFFSDWIFELLTHNRDLPELNLFRQLWLFFIIGIYFVYFWSRNGQTLAMKTWRIQLVDVNDGKVPRVKAVVRYCLAWMWFLPAIVLAYEFGLKGWNAVLLIVFGMAAWAMTIYRNKDHQFLHDHFAKTKLIQLESPKHD